MSSRPAELRRTSAVVALFVGLVVLVAGAVGLGGRIDRSRTLPGLRGQGAEAYARNALGELAPISAEFTEREVGRDVLYRPSEPEDQERPPESGVRPSRPSSPPPTIRGAPGTFPGLAPGGWVLALTMSADRSTVSAGDEIRYRMVVHNTGGGDFRGRSFRLEWHTPTNTFGRNSVEQCSLLPSWLLRLCGNRRLMFSAGLGESSHENLDTSGLVAIRPGQQFVHDWYVQVLPSASSGTGLLNHAHLTVGVGGENVRIRSNDVMVTVQ